MEHTPLPPPHQTRRCCTAHHSTVPTLVWRAQAFTTKRNDTLCRLVQWWLQHKTVQMVEAAPLLRPAGWLPVPLPLLAQGRSGRRCQAHSPINILGAWQPAEHFLSHSWQRTEADEAPQRCQSRRCFAAARCCQALVLAPSTSRLVSLVVLTLPFAHLGRFVKSNPACSCGSKPAPSVDGAPHERWTAGHNTIQLLALSGLFPGARRGSHRPAAAH